MKPSEMKRTTRARRSGPTRTRRKTAKECVHLSTSYCGGCGSVRCFDCRAMLSLGPSNDAPPQVAIDIRAAEISAQATADGSHTVRRSRVLKVTGAEWDGWLDNAMQTVPGDPKREAGWLARQAYPVHVTHEPHEIEPEVVIGQPGDDLGAPIVVEEPGVHLDVIAGDEPEPEHNVEVSTDLEDANEDLGAPPPARWADLPGDKADTSDGGYAYSPGDDVS